jgi:hypothetical protein
MGTRWGYAAVELSSEHCTKCHHHKQTKKNHFLHHNAGKSLNDSMIHQFKIFSRIQTSSYSKKDFQTLFIHGTVCLATGT